VARASGGGWNRPSVRRRVDLDAQATRGRTGGVPREEADRWRAAGRSRRLVAGATGRLLTGSGGDWIRGAVGEWERGRETLALTMLG
jgi:hypothetical protein